MAGLLTIPCSNADSERGFSILRKIHTEQCSNLDQSTIIALIALKMNCDNCCYKIKLQKELFSSCKKATNLELSKKYLAKKVLIMWVWLSVPDLGFEKLVTMYFNLFTIILILMM